MIILYSSYWKGLNIVDDNANYPVYRGFLSVVEYLGVEME